MIIWVTPPPQAKEYGMEIPLSAVLEEDGSLTIHAFPEVKEAALWLDSLKEVREIDDRICRQLDESMRPIMRERGFATEKGDIGRLGYVFAATKQEQIQQALIRPDTVRYRRRFYHRCLTESKLDRQSDACTIFATMRGNRVLSFANLNSDDGEVAEIGTETAKEWEGQGLAASNVAALTLDLLNKGREKVLYVALRDNPASIRVAQKVGFRKTAQEYNYVCFEVEN